MEDTLLALDILRRMNIAVLVRKAPGTYEIFGKVPSFYSELFPAADGAPCSKPWEHSPMLDMFVVDAEMFFARSDGNDAFSSGVWQEDGVIDGDTALIAEAFTVANTQMIVVRLLQQDYRDRVGILNDARAKLLETREISRNLDYYREKSRLDGLTGVLNRATFVELMHNFIMESNVKSKNLSLIMLDIDNFKKFNDTYGHLAGDEVLRSVGAYLKESCQNEDLVARYGGEEFCLVLRGSTQENTIKIANIICEGIRKIRIAALPSITVSVGCTMYRRNESVEQLIKRADMALYDIKYSTKNGVSMR
ncbi:MAG: GGDEF domain-containing protein [Helicobacteraceae bacterium]|jgi:diguanylate cyclase (GGDEF)-like protein|nr:GGDEF domain-containing protein [Helicobacteraceae bacterium]